MTHQPTQLVRASATSSAAPVARPLHSLALSMMVALRYLAARSAGDASASPPAPRPPHS